MTNALAYTLWKRQRGAAAIRGSRDRSRSRRLDPTWTIGKMKMIRETIDTSVTPPNPLLRRYSCSSALARCFPWLVLSLSLSGCGLLDARSIKWTEDVKFPDGRVVSLTRYQEFRDADHDPGDYWFEFKDPDTGETIRWESDRGTSTLALFKHENRNYLLLTFSYGTITFRKFDCPNPPYVLRTFANGAWVDIDLKKIPIRKIKVNMSHAIFGDFEKIKLRRKHLTVADTQNYEYHGNTGRPYVLDFGLMKDQSFGGNNCGGSSDDLIAQ